MTDSAAFRPAAGNSDHIAAVPRADEPLAGPKASRPRPVGRLLRPSHVPVRPIPDVLRGPSQPLAAPVREEMEARLGADFSRVRLHTGSAARASATGVGARAYTSGSHVVIGDGGGDKHTLAHELTHVIQQRQGPVAGTDHGNGLKVSGPSDQFERAAEANASRAMSRPVPTGASSALARNPNGPASHVATVSDTVQCVRTDEQGRYLIIGDAEAQTTIRSASDLLVWLVSHPTESADTPRNFADSQTLLRVLRKLEQESQSLAPEGVWAALRKVTEPEEEAESTESESGTEEEAESTESESGTEEEAESTESESGTEEEAESTESESGTEEGWPEGEWRKKVDEYGIEVEYPSEFRRQMSPEEYNKQLTALQGRLAGHKLIGISAIKNPESLGPLIKEGVSNAMVGTGHGAGKGRGFYLIPTVITGGGFPARSGFPTLAKAAKSAGQWGDFVVAAYLPNECRLVSAVEGENVDTLEKEHEGEECYYVFGKQEVVIPPSLFGKTMLVRDPADITMADPALPAAVSEEDPLSFVTKMSEMGSSRKS